MKTKNAFATPSRKRSIQVLILLIASAFLNAVGIANAASTSFLPEHLNRMIEWAFPNEPAEFKAYVTPKDGMYDLMKGFKAKNLSPELILRRNDWILNELTPYSKNALQGQGITLAQAEALLTEARNHPVVGIAALDHYDPRVPDPKDPSKLTRNYGFCFGRSEYLYLRLLQEGVKKEAVLKLFDMGDIYGDPSFGKPWPYHMVTIVKASDSDGWYAIDPFYGKVMTPRQWVELNNSHMTDSAHPPIVYLSAPGRAFAAAGSDLPSSVKAMKLAGIYIQYYVDMWNSAPFGGEAYVTSLLTNAR